MIAFVVVLLSVLAALLVLAVDASFAPIDEPAGLEDWRP